MRTLKPGLRLRSAVCSTEVMVIRAPGLDAELACGGVPMVGLTETAPTTAAILPGHGEGTLVGKRYVDARDAVEVLCTRGGEGSLALDSTAMSVKQAKALPSSD